MLALQDFILNALRGERFHLRARRRVLRACPPTIDTLWSMADRTPPEQRTKAQRAALAVSDELIAEVVAADVVVLTLCIDDVRCTEAFARWLDLLNRTGLTVDAATAGPTDFLGQTRAILGGLSRLGPTADQGFATLQAFRARLKGVGFAPIEVLTAGTRPAYSRLHHGAATPIIH
jgi:FMN-dependent NADH-azoreductase